MAKSGPDGSVKAFVPNLTKFKVFRVSGVNFNKYIINIVSTSRHRNPGQTLTSRTVVVLIVFILPWAGSSVLVGDIRWNHYGIDRIPHHGPVCR